MEERTTGPAFTRQEQRVNQLAAQYVELVNRGQDRNSERLTALSTQIWLGTVEAMERTLGGRALDQERRIANSGRDYEEQDLKLSLIHISEPTRRVVISYAVFCLKKIFFNDTATTEIYTRLFVGSVRCV